MGQVIAGATPEGALIAADSRAVMFEPFGEERFITLDRGCRSLPMRSWLRPGPLGPPFIT